MNKTAVLGKRNLNEILRDPLTLSLGVLFPVGLLLLFTMLEKSAPMSLFQLNALTPAIVIFGQAFFIMFTAILISRDRHSALFTRFRSAPLCLRQFLVAYSVPFLLALALQGIVCVSAATVLGYDVQDVSPLALPFLLFVGLFHITAGVSLGLILTEKQIAGVGTLLINAAGIFGGAWIDLEQIGGVVSRIARLLPFAHFVDGARALMQAGAGRQTFTPETVTVLLIYTLSAIILALLLMRRVINSR